MAEKITELYIKLESRMKKLHEEKKIPEKFYNTYVSVCTAHNNCIKDQGIFHKFMMGIRPENVTSTKELPPEFLDILKRSFPAVAEAEISGPDLANLVICAYNSCCQYGRSLANRLSQLYKQASISDSTLADMLEEFEAEMQKMNPNTQQ